MTCDRGPVLTLRASVPRFLLLGCGGAALMLNLVHWGLNAGNVDESARYARLIASWLYLPCLILASSAIVNRVARSRCADPGCGWAWVLLGFGAFQAASLVLSPRYQNSSVWQPTYPAFVGGFIMAALTVRVANSQLGLRSARIATTATALLWMVGQLCTDVLAYSENPFGPRDALWMSAAGPISATMSGLTVASSAPLFWAVHERDLATTVLLLGLPCAWGWRWAAKRAGLRPGAHDCWPRAEFLCARGAPAGLGQLHLRLRRVY